MTRTIAVTLFHNSGCSTSRAVLALLRDAGCQPEIVDYMRQGWSRERLTELFSAMRVGAGDVLRRKEPLAATLGLLEPATEDETILLAMLAHPVLVERPIVLTPLGAVLARPAERAWTVLSGRQN